MVFTRGPEFTHRGAAGKTGDWIIDPARNVDWVIVYHRDGADGGAIWRGRPSGIVGPVPPSARHPKGKPRYRVSLVGLRLVGRTQEDWRSFAETWTNPVRYIGR